MVVGLWAQERAPDRGNAFRSPGSYSGVSGSKVVKGFNHLIASVLAEEPAVNGGSRVVFLASDNDCALNEVGTLAETPGFASMVPGSLSEGEMLVQAHRIKWGELIFKDLVKFSK